MFTRMMSVKVIFQDAWAIASSWLNQINTSTCHLRLNDIHTNVRSNFSQYNLLIILTFALHLYRFYLNRIYDIKDKANWAACLRGTRA